MFELQNFAYWDESLRNLWLSSCDLSWSLPAELSALDIFHYHASMPCSTPLKSTCTIQYQNSSKYVNMGSSSNSQITEQNLLSSN